MTSHAFLAAGLMLGSCFAGANEGQESRSARLGESFRLRLGEAARVEDADVKVTFQEVSSDSRCPRDVNCIQAGEAVVLLTLQNDAGRNAVLELAVPPGGESPPVAFEKLRIVILDLEPHKESTKSIDSSAYVATLRISQP